MECTKCRTVLKTRVEVRCCPEYFGDSDVCGDCVNALELPINCKICGTDLKEHRRKVEPFVKAAEAVYQHIHPWAIRGVEMCPSALEGLNGILLYKTPAPYLWTDEKRKAMLDTIMSSEHSVMLVKYCLNASWRHGCFWPSPDVVMGPYLEYAKKELEVTPEAKALWIEQEKGVPTIIDASFCHHIKIDDRLDDPELISDDVRSEVAHVYSAVLGKPTAAAEDSAADD